MAISSLESNWAWLPEGLLDSILDKVVSSFDRVRFGAVCESWGTAVKEGRRLKTQVTQPPMLLIPSKDNNEKVRSLYSVTDRKISEYNLPMPYDRRCCGSSLGWLSFVTETLCVTLFNPFRNEKIHLPQIILSYKGMRRTYQYLVVKVMLSSDPTSSREDCFVAAIFGKLNDLAFMKIGDESWTYVDNDRKAVFSDILYFKGKILALDHRSGLISIDVNTCQETLLAPGDLEYFMETYLVETSSGDLLLVQRFFFDQVDENQQFLTESFDQVNENQQFLTECFDQVNENQQFLTERFEVYKLVLDDESDRVVERVKVKNIGDNALFLGDNQSIAVSASAFPGCQPNSIYYTDDYLDTWPYEPDGPIDMGIFNLEDGSIQLHYKPNPSHKHMPPPIWMLPPML